MNNIVAFCGVNFDIYGIILAVLFLIFVFGLVRAGKRYDWTDMITRDGTKISATKVLQLIGGVVGTWIMVKTTMQEKLTWDLFAIYLSYVASIDGFAKLIMAKYGVASSDDSKVPFPQSPTPPTPQQTNGAAKPPDIDP